MLTCEYESTALNTTDFPVLYSFRRCPYAIRARITLLLCAQCVELREVLLNNKPPQMVALSKKATVPILCLTDKRVLDESLEIMRWAIAESGDPAGLFADTSQQQKQLDLIARNDSEFKYWLDRYKYHVRFPEYPQEYYRRKACQFLHGLEARVASTQHLLELNRNWLMLRLCRLSGNFPVLTKSGSTVLMNR